MALQAVVCGPGPRIPACDFTGAWIDIVESAQVVVRNVDTLILMDRDLFELLPTDADAASERIIIGITGIYLVGFGLTLDSNGTAGNIAATVFVNGVAVPGVPQQVVAANLAAPTSAQDARLIGLQAGDVLTLHVFQGTDASMNLISAALSAALMGCIG